MKLQSEDVFVTSGESVLEQRLPALTPFDPLARFIQGESARPRREGLSRIVRFELFPERNRSLLNDLFRIGQIRNKRGYIPKNFPFATKE